MDVGKELSWERWQLNAIVTRMWKLCYLNNIIDVNWLSKLTGDVDVSRFNHIFVLYVNRVGGYQQSTSAGIFTPVDIPIAMRSSPKRQIATTRSLDPIHFEVFKILSIRQQTVFYYFLTSTILPTPPQNTRVTQLSTYPASPTNTPFHSSKHIIRLSESSHSSPC